MINHKCNGGACDGSCNESKSTKKAVVNTSASYAFYSRVLNKPFDSIAELQEAENAYYAEQRAKEAAANSKTADAKKVEEAFKALNAARKDYKEKLEQLTDEYSEALANIKKAFEAGREDLQKKLTTAEDVYAKALKEFTEKYPEYTLTLDDGNTKAVISSQTKSANNKKVDNSMRSLFDLLFNF